jgi:hypothetical protein
MRVFTLFMLVCGLKTFIVLLKLLEKMSQVVSVEVHFRIQIYAGIKMLQETGTVGEISEY